MSSGITNKTNGELGGGQVDADLALAEAQVRVVGHADAERRVVAGGLVVVAGLVVERDGDLCGLVGRGLVIVGLVGLGGAGLVGGPRGADADDLVGVDAQMSDFGGELKRLVNKQRTGVRQLSGS